MAPLIINSYLFSSTPVYLSSVSPLSPCFLALVFTFFLSFLLLLPCTSQKSLKGSSSTLFPPVSFHAFSTTLDPTLFQLSLSLLSPIQLYQLRLKKKNRRVFLTPRCHFNFLTSLAVSSGCIGGGGEGGSGVGGGSEQDERGKGLSIVNTWGWNVDLRNRMYS